LVSGRGSNLRAIVEATARGALAASVAVVVSNRADASAIAFAQAAGIATRVIPHGMYDSRAAYDRALVEALRAHGVRLVCLAGFMRLVGPDFCGAFRDAVLNVHPSLLPAFPGRDAQRQALEHGVTVAGATVHFVTPELDAGPIVLQAFVPVEEADTVESLSARILAVEHRIYPEAIGLVIAGGWRIEGRRVRFDRGPASR
jgi:phosphoribosylglycinamide formyltransferase-1